MQRNIRDDMDMNTIDGFVEKIMKINSGAVK
jgi:hypothetical protein